MSVLYPEFHRVKNRAEGRAKLGAEAEAGERRAWWSRAKEAAARDPGGRLVGLTKLAVELWSDHLVSTGEKTACDHASREQWAASFACAAVVDDALDGMAKRGELSAEEHAKLASLNAESALTDLRALTKTAGPLGGLGSILGVSGLASHGARTLLDLMKRHPELPGAIGGAVLGASVGAMGDSENRVRGGLVGALPGAAIGASLGGGLRQQKHGADMMMPGQGAGLPPTPPVQPAEAPPGAGGPPGMGGQPGMGGPPGAGAPPGMAPGGAPPGGASGMGGDQMQAGDAEAAQQAQEQAQKDTLRHQGNLEVLLHVAQTTNNPGLAAEIQQRSEELLQHLASGNTSLPAWAQRHFPTAEHARHFAEVVRKRTTPMFGGAGGKK